MKLMPLNENLFVKVDAVEKKTDGGIIIPDSVNIKPNSGVVVFADKGTVEKPVYVEAGHRVLFNKQAGVPVEIDGENFLVLKQQDVLCVQIS